MRQLKPLLEKIRWRFATAPTYDPTAMAELIGGEWFTRMWTIQELVMANEPFIVCGDNSTRWNDLNWAYYRCMFELERQERC